MSTLEFDKWWKEFDYYHIKDNDNGKSLINELMWTLQGFTKRKRIAFINALIKRKNMSIAVNLIPKYGNLYQKLLLRLYLFFQKISNI